MQRDIDVRRGCTANGQHYRNSHAKDRVFNFGTSRYMLLLCKIVERLDNIAGAPVQDSCHAMYQTLIVVDLLLAFQIEDILATATQRRTRFENHVQSSRRSPIERSRTLSLSNINIGLKTHSGNKKSFFHRVSAIDNRSSSHSNLCSMNGTLQDYFCGHHGLAGENL